MQDSRMTIRGSEMNSVEYHALLVGDRLRRYLAAVDPARLPHSRDILQLYNLLDIDNVLAHCARNGKNEEAKEVFAALGAMAAVLFSDLERHYGVREADLVAKPIAVSQEKLFFDVGHMPRPEVPKSTIAALANHARPPRVENLPPRKSPFDPRPSVYVKPQLSRPNAHAADHAIYASVAMTPPGFKREEARCPECGVEALNPVELQRHLRMRHAAKTNEHHVVYSELFRA